MRIRFNMFFSGFMMQTLFFLLLGSGFSSLIVSGAPVGSSATLIDTGTTRSTRGRSVEATSMRSCTGTGTTHLKSRAYHPFCLTPAEILQIQKKHHPMAGLEMVTFGVWFADSESQKRRVTFETREEPASAPEPTKEAVRKRIAQLEE
ncbi:hypothetical protein C8R42DRAFT_425063 [Lentinula raphanica]|nr:hypothetical protein C8R42DRAFT_425063 [Lentinula raphanica]